MDEEDTVETPAIAAEELPGDDVARAFRVSDFSASSAVGFVRESNEDRWSRVGHSVFVVADGMGGHEGGEVAAQAAVDTVEAMGEEGLLGSIESLVAEANTAVLAAGRAQGLQDLGSTLVMLALRGRSVIVVSVGDSRVYRLRHGSLMQLTHDHTLRNELLDAGVRLEGYAARGVRLDALTGYVGMSGRDVPPISEASFALADGDRFLLCSDGVHGQVDHPTLLACCSAPSCEEGVDSMLEYAAAAGGSDNATAVLVEFAAVERDHR